MPTSRTGLLSALLVLVLGCAPVAGPETDTDDPDFGHDGFDPYWFGVQDARFGVDGATQTAVAVEVFDDDVGDFVTQPVTLTVLVTSQRGLKEGITTENSCSVEIELPGPIPLASWQSAASAWFAFEITRPEGNSDCNMLDFPPSWGTAPVDHITKWVWGAGVHELSTQAADDYRNAVGDEVYDALQPFLIGGGYYWDALASGQVELNHPTGYVSQGVAIAHELDGSMRQVRDGGLPVYLRSVDVLDGSGVQTAYYEILSNVLLSPASHLRLDP